MTHNPEREMLLAVIATATRDLEKGTGADCRSARVWIDEHGGSFEAICELLELSAMWMRKGIASGQGGRKRQLGRHYNKRQKGQRNGTE